MTKINGIEIKGIKKLCTETRYITDFDNYVEIFMDTATNEVWGNWHYNTNEWTVYHDDAVVRIANVYEPKTMKELKEIIAREM